MTARFLADLARMRGVANRNPLVLAPLGVLSVLAYRRLLTYDPGEGLSRSIDPVEGVFFSPADSSPLLILALTTLLLYARRHRLALALGVPGRMAVSVLLLVPAAVLNVWAYYVGVPALLIISLSLLFLGGAHLTAGAPGVKVVLFPAVFVLLAVPIPAVVVNAVVFPQQLLTAEITAAVLSSIGIPTIAHGDLILTPTRSFQVIESCSGLRTLLTMVMSGLLYAEIFYRGRLQATILIVSSPFIGLVVNQVRVLSLTLLPGSHITDIHTFQGIVMLVCGVLGLAVLDRVLLRVLNLAPRGSGDSAMDASGEGRAAAFPLARIVALGVLLALLSVSKLVFAPWTAPPDPYESVFRLTTLVSHMHATGFKVDPRYLGSVRFSQQVNRRFLREDGDIDLFVGIDDRLDPRVSLRSDKTVTLGKGSRIRKRYAVALERDGRMVNAFLVEVLDRIVLVFHWYENVDSLFVETIRSLFGLDRSPLRRDSRASVIRLSTPIELDSGGVAGAEARLQSFLVAIWPLLERVEAV